MKEYSRITVARQQDVLRVTLNRSEVHNAFDDVLIGEMIGLFGDAKAFEGIRAVVLGGTGANFCAGADLNWMSSMVEWSLEENADDARRLSMMFRVIDRCPVPVVGRIQGAAIGGGVGLVAVCDIAIATEDAKFGLSEVKLGILPAVISPYVMAKIGVSHARALFFTGERFGADRAMRIGLVHDVVKDDEALDTAVDRVLRQIRSSGPDAVRACKRLVEAVAASEIDDAISYTVEAIAERRISDEGQAGMRAFLRKEKAPWVNE